MMKIIATENAIMDWLALNPNAEVLKIEFTTDGKNRIQAIVTDPATIKMIQGDYIKGVSLEDLPKEPWEDLHGY